jgi:hypothetical protein
MLSSPRIGVELPRRSLGCATNSVWQFCFDATFDGLVLKPEGLIYPVLVMQPPDVSNQNEKPEGLTYQLTTLEKQRFNSQFLCRPFRQRCEAFLFRDLSNFSGRALAFGSVINRWRASVRFR